MLSQFRYTAYGPLDRKIGRSHVNFLCRPLTTLQKIRHCRRPRYVAMWTIKTASEPDVVSEILQFRIWLKDVSPKRLRAIKLPVQSDLFARNRLTLDP